MSGKEQPSLGGAIGWLVGAALLALPSLLALRHWLHMSQLDGRWQLGSPTREAFYKASPFVFAVFGAGALICLWFGARALIRARRKR